VTHFINIDFNHFTPWSALIGGLILGIAAVIFILVNGRITGISGILGGLLSPTQGDVWWRVAFIAGLMMAPLIYGLFITLPPIQIDASYPLLIIAGLIVGIGTRYGSGCTSGHGICGISRLSPRSLVATAAFMAAGFITVFIIRHIIAGS
jgi:uncharacterized membrane protein YedE/YeeE